MCPGHHKPRLRACPAGAVLLALPLLLACGEPVPSGLPAPGAYALASIEAPQERWGSLTVTRSWRGAPGARLELVGPSWMTPGPVTARLEHGELGGAPVSWLAFPLRTAVGEAEAVAQIQGQSLVLPLGARPQEHEQALRIVPEPAAGLAWRHEAEAVQRSLDTLERGWAQGRIQLIDTAGELVGEVLMMGEHPPLIAVYDHQWMTPGEGTVPAGRAEEGGDLLLSFPVEPSLEGEQGLVRINIPSQELVVPLGPAPVPEERHLALRMGEVDAETRARARARARQQADREERAYLQELAPQLSAALMPGEAGADCAPAGSLAAHWELLLAGYDLQLGRDTGGCAVWVAPTVEQHRRRHRMELGSDGRVEIIGPD